MACKVRVVDRMSTVATIETLDVRVIIANNPTDGVIGVQLIVREFQTIYTLLERSETTGA